MSKIKRLLEYSNYLSINVLLATAVCAIAFFKLPDGNGNVEFLPLVQIVLAAWAVYILDRILDNQKTIKPKTLRHEFYEKHQFNLSILLLAIIVINTVLVFFEKTNVIIFGFVISLGIGCYLFSINKISNFKFYKELIMPFLFVSAVVGVPFVGHSSINLSSWILAFIFLLIIFQNLLTFSIFESLDDPETVNICKVYGVKLIQKWMLRLTSIIIVIVILLFTSENTYGSRLAIIFVILSLIMSYSVTKPLFFIKNERYRYIIDGLLLFPVFIF